MKSYCRRMGALILCWACATIAISCASAPPPNKQEAWPAATNEDLEKADQEDSPGSATDDPCMGSGGEPMRCTSDEDCCKGMDCGLDPDQSRIYRYCLGG